MNNFSFKRWFEINFGQYRFARKLIGGRWEKWIIPCCLGSLWLKWDSRTQGNPIGARHVSDMTSTEQWHEDWMEATIS